jgi:hypothetical protein
VELTVSATVRVPLGVKNGTAFLGISAAARAIAGTRIKRVSKTFI